MLLRLDQREFSSLVPSIHLQEWQALKLLAHQVWSLRFLLLAEALEELLEHMDLALEQVSWSLASLLQSSSALLQEQLEVQQPLGVVLVCPWL